MTEPNTVNKGLIVPNTGDLAGTWGSAALNPDFVALDGMLGGFVTVSLTNANVTLTAPAGATIVPAAGPNQSQNSLIIFSGTLTGNCIITFPLPGQYNILNNCVVGAFYVQLSGGAGNKIGIPPGQAVSVFSNGTDMQFISLPITGSYWDYAGSGVPAWITACTVLPWLVCDGSTPLIATYPQLAAILGTTFGGNGISTFGVPDLRNRARFMIDTNQGGLSSRITTVGSGINGQALGAAGGDQLTQTHTHGVTEPNAGTGHSHNLLSNGNGVTFLETSAGGGQAYTAGGQATIGGVSATQLTPSGVTINNYGGGAGQNMPPVLISGLAFIKT